MIPELTADVLVAAVYKRLLCINTNRAGYLASIYLSDNPNKAKMIGITVI